MGRARLRLGRIFGVEVFADIGVLVIGGLLAWSFASGYLPEVAPGRVTAAYWSVGILGALLFLVSLLAHELSHSVVAIRNGLKVKGITLWLFGGVEFRIAIAGPAASVGMGALFGALALGLNLLGSQVLWVSMLVWLALINVLLAVFNLLPGAPLDGGRVLASAVWKVKGDRLAGRIAAARAGRVVALLLIGLGVLEIAAWGSYGGLWTMLIGWFLFTASKVEAGVYGAERDLGGMTVAGAMLSPVQVTSTWSMLDQVVTGPFAHTAQTAVPVVDQDRRLRGAVLLDRVRQVPAEQWAHTPVTAVMVPLDQLARLDPAQPMSEVLDALATGQAASATTGIVLGPDGSLMGLLGPEEIRRAVDLGRTRRKGSRPGGSAGPPPAPGRVVRQDWQAPTHTH
jgi:Zn-dependent protease